MLFWIGMFITFLSHLALKASDKNLFFVITWTLGLFIAFLGLVDVFTF